MLIEKQTTTVALDWFNYQSILTVIAETGRKVHAHDTFEQVPSKVPGLPASTGHHYPPSHKNIILMDRSEIDYHDNVATNCIFTSPDVPENIEDVMLQKAEPGTIVVFEQKKIRSDRQATPLALYGNLIAARIL